MSAEICQKLVESLKKRGFEAEYAASREDAVSLVLAEAVNARSVGWGGSETVKELGLREAMVDAGKDIRDHQLEMDLFLLSANAVTLDGRIVNIDGRGNRVAASIAGPKRVVYLIGRNKIVDGGIDAAIDRVKRFACAPNCRRLGKRTPCAETGVCADCDSPDRICKVMAVFDRKPTGISAKVIVVDSDLGY
jgi:L-lactate utilization protein LutB